MSPVPDRQEIEELTTGDRSISLARTECHYAINDFFMPTGNYIIENADRIKHISCHIIHGRYDIVCPVKGAWDLHKVLPDSTITIAPMGGHTLADKGMKTAMISALNAPVIFM